MVFMGEATIEGTAPLETPAKNDIAEMTAIGSGNGLNVFVQRNGRGTPLRRHIGKGPWRKVPPNQQVFENGEAIGHFIRWALMEAGHRAEPDGGDYSMLVLWGHAYDFTFGRRQREDGVIDALDFAELSAVLARFRRQYGSEAKLDIIAFDACELATVELAYQLSPFATFLLGSQVGIPLPGWPYDRILDRLRHPKGDRMTPPECGAYIVRRFCESYSPSRPTSLSLLDLRRTTALFNRAEALGDRLIDAIRDPEMLQRIIEIFIGSRTRDGKPYVDVADLCLSLARDSGHPKVVAAAIELGNFLTSPRPPLADTSADAIRRPFILEHGRNSGQGARLNGVSMYAPHVAPSDDFDALRPLYINFEFVQKTRWSELVYTLARLS